VRAGGIKVSKGYKTIIILAIIFITFMTGTAMAADHPNSTANATPTATPSIAPTPGATVTPVPTPAPRQVFSSPKWDNDHETIAVSNNGGPISVVAWIDSPSKYLKYQVDAGQTETISTPSILTQVGQIVNFGFQAYENNTLIDSYNATISVGPMPTALPPETVSIAGTIIDAGNSSPIVGATVTFRSITYGKTYPAVTTGSDGSYVSPKMYPDEYSIKVSTGGYQAITLTTEKITSDSMVDSISLKRMSGTPTPVPPSPTPSSPVDAWLSLLSNPIACLGSLTALVTAIGGSIGIYEWMEKRKNIRLQGKNEPPGGIKKP
jgi:hypothetical protein